MESPKVEQTFRFFQVEKKYAVSKRDDVYLYEKKNTKSDKVGKINALGVLHILEEDDDGEWYYVESGKARGFIKAKYVWADEKAERYVKHKKEKNIETAEVLKEAYENKAFLHTQTTAYKAVAKKKYALTKKENQDL
ncbi:MAG: SH3 domain-containing protein [Lachnospiraceae bacterium]